MSEARRGAAELARAIFERGSKTYYNSSRLFPAWFREPLATLYAFVRTADDYVDAIPQDAAGFFSFRAEWERAKLQAGHGAGQAGTAGGGSAGGAAAAVPGAIRDIVGRFATLSREQGFEPAWTEAFLDAMQADLSVREYNRIEDTLRYIYGSAEVIGLFMTALMKLPPESRQSAMMLGRSMQYVNFIRDFDEDRRLGRRYLPLEGADPRVADPDWARAHPEEFSAFMRKHIERYREWGKLGREGFAWIPGRFRAAIATAQDMYDWSARHIERNPLVVFDRKMKPPKWRILLQGVWNLAIHGWSRGKATQ